MTAERSRLRLGDLLPGPITPNGSRSAAPRTPSPRGSRFNSHTSGVNTWAAPTFNVTVNTAGDIAAIQQELDKEQET